MKKCKNCGSKKFYNNAITTVWFDLDDYGVLTPKEEEKKDYEDVFFCAECNEEYQAEDFEEIL